MTGGWRGETLASPDRRWGRAVFRVAPQPRRMVA